VAKSMWRTVYNRCCLTVAAVRIVWGIGNPRLLYSRSGAFQFWANAIIARAKETGNYGTTEVLPVQVESIDPKVSL
jgi:hypothetical protein